MPMLELDAGWVVGHAVQKNVVFTNGGTGRREIFLDNCFRDLSTSLVVLGVDHQVCRCFDPGRSWKTEPADALLNWDLVLASSRTKTLIVGEDSYGLFFAAKFRDCIINYGDAPGFNVHDAIAEGRCLGLSMHSHGGDRAVGGSVPADVYAWQRAPLQEISLCFSQPPDSPGTWAALAGPAATREYHDRLRSVRESIGVNHVVLH